MTTFELLLSARWWEPIAWLHAWSISYRRRSRHALPRWRRHHNIERSEAAQHLPSIYFSPQFFRINAAAGFSQKNRAADITDACVHRSCLSLIISLYSPQTLILAVGGWIYAGRAGLLRWVNTVTSITSDDDFLTIVGYLLRHIFSCQHVSRIKVCLMPEYTQNARIRLPMRQPIPLILLSCVTSLTYHKWPMEKQIQPNATQITAYKPWQSQLTIPPSF